MHFLEDSLLVICAATGLGFIIMSYYVSKYPPKKINGFYGYRTKSSMLSDERWHFAQQYSNDLMFKYGIIMLISGIAGHLINMPKFYGTLLALTFIIALVVLLFLKTEQALKDKFDK